MQFRKSRFNWRALFVLWAVWGIVPTVALAKEPGLPQLDPKYLAPQAFWLIIVFSILCIFMWRVGTPKIEKVLARREETVRKDIDEATVMRDMAAAMIAKSDDELEKARRQAKKELNASLAASSKEASDYQISAEKDIATKTASAILKLKDAQRAAKSHLEEAAVAVTAVLLKKVTGTGVTEDKIKKAISETGMKS